MKTIQPDRLLTLASIGQDLRGKLGEGGPAVKISTVNGGIHLDRSKTVALDNR